MQRSDTNYAAVRALGVHHVGITVRDLRASLSFYAGSLDGEVLFRIEQSGPVLAAALGVHDAHLHLVFVRLGDAFVELLQFQSPEGAAVTGEPYDPGCVHIAITVRDLEASCRRLRRDGVRVSEPSWVQEGPTAGAGFAYCRDPDGVVVELYQTTDAVEQRRTSRPGGGGRSRGS